MKFLTPAHLAHKAMMFFGLIAIILAFKPDIVSYLGPNQYFDLVLGRLGLSRTLKASSNFGMIRQKIKFIISTKLVFSKIKMLV